MSMHLHHPSLTLSGKKKTKQKFKNAAMAKQARELDRSWNELQKRWGIEQEEKKKQKALTTEVWKPQPDAFRRTTDHIQSLNCGKDMGSASLKPTKVYTGDKMLGISQMAKSNAIPVFNFDHIKDISKMRR